MKALLISIMLILSAQLASAQNKGADAIPVPVVDSTICYEGVIKANPALTRDQLYQKVRQWASAKIIVPPNIPTLLYDNPAEGNLSARMIFHTINESSSAITNYMIPQAIIHIQVKEGKIKYTITDFLYIHGDISNSAKFITEGDGKAMIYNATSDKKLKSHKTEFIFYMTEINRIIQDKLKSLQAYIKRTVIDEF